MRAFFAAAVLAAIAVASILLGKRKARRRAMRVLARIDIQNTFMPADPNIAGTGELPVPGAPAVIPVINRLSRCGFFDMIVDSQDYHPPDHGSFYTMHAGKQAGEIIDLHGLRQILWNPHGRQNTPGSEFHPTLDRTCVTRTFPKGMDRDVDSYSAIWDNGRRHSTGMAEYVKEEAERRGFPGVEFYVVGVTRPFCPSWTAKDAREFGFDTFLVQDACSLLELEPGAGARDIRELEDAGVKVIQSRDILSSAVS